MTERPTRFGVFMQPLHDPDENPTLALERDLELLEHLDRLGFDEAWIGEHHSTGWETIASPAIFIATAAQRTRHIRLGSGVVPVRALGLLGVGKQGSFQYPNLSGILHQA